MRFVYYEYFAWNSVGGTFDRKYLSSPIMMNLVPFGTFLGFLGQRYPFIHVPPRHSPLCQSPPFHVPPVQVPMQRSAQTDDFRSSSEDSSVEVKVDLLSQQVGEGSNEQLVGHGNHLG